MSKASHPGLVFVLSLSFALLAPTAHANLRAPEMARQSPSTAPYGIADQVAVQGEELRFEFRLVREGRPGESTCLVTATYHIESALEQEVQLEFLAPSSGEVTWTLGAQSGKTEFVHETDTTDAPESIKHLVSGKPVERRELSRREEPDAVGIFRARFPVRLNAGAQVLEIRYAAAPAYFEVDYGYFRSSKFRFSVDYEIWPLKQWTLADDFALEVQATVHEPVRGMWARWRNRNDAVWAVDETGEALGDAESKFQDGRLVAVWRFDRHNLPDRLSIRTAPASHAPVR